MFPRRPYAFLLAQLNLFLAPVVAALVLVSALLAAPLLSLFTLPLYFLTYPRPARFWPGPVGHNATASPDSVLYQQVTSLIHLVVETNLREDFTITEKAPLRELN